jgi:hypothetical protein
MVRRSMRMCGICCSWVVGKCRWVVAGVVVVVGIVVGIAVAGKKKGHNLVTSKIAAAAVLVAAKKIEMGIFLVALVGVVVVVVVVDSRYKRTWPWEECGQETRASRDVARVAASESSPGSSGESLASWRVLSTARRNFW